MAAIALVCLIVLLAADLRERRRQPSRSELQTWADRECSRERGSR